MASRARQLAPSQALPPFRGHAPKGRAPKGRAPKPKDKHLKRPPSKACKATLGLIKNKPSIILLGAYFQLKLIELNLLFNKVVRYYYKRLTIHSAKISISKLYTLRPLSYWCPTARFSIIIIIKTKLRYFTGTS